MRNEQVRNTFYAMPCVKNMIAARQLDFIGKLIRGPHDQPARRMITSCCNETRRVRRPQTTEKNCIVKNLRLLFKDVPLKHIDHHGSLKHWIHEASNEEYWNQLIKRLTHPETPLPERPEEWGPLPSWQARHANITNEDESDNSDDEDEHNNNQDNAENEEPLPPRRPPPRNQPPPPSSQSTERIYDPKLWLNNPEMCEMIGRSLGASLQIFDLGLGASEIEAKMKYRQLSQIYHPDKNNQATTGLTTEEATEFFKLLNNANEYLKERL